MQTHAHDNKIPPNTPVHRILTLVLFLISCTHRRNTIKCTRTPQTHTSEHEWWHCQRLLCSTLFAVSFQGPTLPSLPNTLHPPTNPFLSHLLIFFFLDTLEQLTLSFRSFSLFFFFFKLSILIFVSAQVCVLQTLPRQFSSSGRRLSHSHHLFTASCST